jgi:hypothetical protein
MKSDDDGIRSGSGKDKLKSLKERSLLAVGAFSPATALGKFWL